MPLFLSPRPSSTTTCQCELKTPQHCTSCTSTPARLRPADAARSRRRHLADAGPRRRRSSSSRRHAARRPLHRPLAPRRSLNRILSRQADHAAGRRPAARRQFMRAMRFVCASVVAGVFALGAIERVRAGQPAGAAAGNRSAAEGFRRAEAAVRRSADRARGEAGRGRGHAAAPAPPRNRRAAAPPPTAPGAGRRRGRRRADGRAAGLRLRGHAARRSSTPTSR